MCGIAGIVNFDGSPVEGELLRGMAAALGPRGPDELAIWIDPERPSAGLAFARLAILDREGGRQPMGEAGRPGRRVVFNGEIYNHLELRRELAGRGHRFASDHSDTEVLLPLYEERGAEMVRELRGMFAFAIYDGPGGRIFLARDRLGKKPLYWAATPKLFAFASELKALRFVPGLDRELDLAAIDLYMQLGYVPSPRTVFRGIKKMGPGTRMTVQLAGGAEMKAESWWEVPASSGAIGQNPSLGPEGPSSPKGEGLTALLFDAVKSRLEADVPLGFFLSGGLDSSVVVALARRAAPERELRTFSVAFPEMRYDESAWAAAMARHVGARHTRLEIAPAALGELLPTMVATFDEPFADSSAMATWLLSQAVRKHVTVALSGDGGDELFGGYERYRAVRLAARMDRWPVVRGLAGVAGRCAGSGRDLKSWRSRLRRFAGALALPPLERYARWVSPFHEDDPYDLYGPRLRETHDGGTKSTGLQADPWHPVTEYLRAHLTAGPLEETVQALDARTYLPEDVLTKVDRASMAHGLEVRSPLVDHRLFEAVGRLSAAEKLGPRGEGKWLLRQLAGELVPPEILARRKMGFGVPVSAWLAGPQAEWMRGRLAEGPLAGSGLVERETMGRYVAEHVAGRADHGPRLYSLLILDEFLRRNG